MALVLLASCASTGSAKVNIAITPKITKPDTKLTDMCSLPVDIGKNKLTKGQVEDFWINDRVSLIDCYYRHKALVDFDLKQYELLKGTK